MIGLDGKIALITGGGKGLGRAAALALAARGVRVVVTGRDERALGETVGEIAHGGGKARHLAGDVRDAALLAGAVDRAVTVFGGLDIVIANAGGAHATFDAAVPHMVGPGRLLVTRGAVTGAPGEAGEVASRESASGLLALVRATARAVAARKITCNAVVPRWVDADQADDRLREVAEVIVLFCSSAADAVTGQAIEVGA